MAGDRWRVAGIASPRARWFFELARWSNAAAIPVEFVKCVSTAEMSSRLTRGESYSALLLGVDTIGLNRTLVSEAADHGAAVILVGEASEHEGASLGINARLPEDFGRDQLISVLSEHAAPLNPTEGDAGDRGSAMPDGWLGTLIIVTGAGGSGTSLLSMALAQGLAAEASNRGLVLLADLALDADQAVMHDSREVIPGLQELVESCHAGWPGHDRLGDAFFEPAGRGYHLLLGLRRHCDWTSLRRRPLEIAMNGLRRTYRFVVADAEPDLEGRSDTGSSGVGDRNRLARTAAAQSDLVMAVGGVDMMGVHSLVRTAVRLADGGVGSERILPVFNRAPRSPQVRASAAATLRQMLETTSAERSAKPVFVPRHRGVESALRDGAALPPALGRMLAAAAVEHVNRSAAL